MNTVTPPSRMPRITGIISKNNLIDDDEKDAPAVESRQGQQIGDGLFLDDDLDGAVLAFGAIATGGYLSSCICALSYGRINDFERIRHAILGQ